MLTIILIAGLLQVTLARHFAGPVIYLPTPVYLGPQFNFRNPDSETYQVHRSNYAIPDSQPYQNGNQQQYERYVDHTSGVEYHNEYEQINQQVPNYETELPKNEYQLQGDDNNGRIGRDDAPYTNVAGNNQKPRGRSRNTGRARNQQGTLKTNLDAQSNAHSEGSDTRAEGSKERQDTDIAAPTNEDSKTRKSNRRFLVKAVPEFSPRVAETPRSLNQSEVTDNNDTSVDNPKSSTPVRTTDNEVKFIKAEGDKEGDWVWSTSPSSTPLPEETTPNDLDDRVAIAGDECPKGQAKIRGQCTATA